MAKDFKKSDKAPAALLASSQSFAALGMRDLAKKALEAVVQEYPRAQEAKIAREKLRRSAPHRRHR